MNRYSVRYAFVCNAPYRCHMVCSIMAESLSAAAAKAQADIDDRLGDSFEVISIHNAGEIKDVNLFPFWR